MYMCLYVVRVCVFIERCPWLLVSDWGTKNSLVQVKGRNIENCVRPTLGRPKKDGTRTWSSETWRPVPYYSFTCHIKGSGDLCRDSRRDLRPMSSYRTSHFWCLSPESVGRHRPRVDTYNDGVGFGTTEGPTRDDHFREYGFTVFMFKCDPLLLIPDSESKKGTSEHIFVFVNRDEVTGTLTYKAVLVSL